ncbi:MAG: DUF885 family protein, partial [Candidatus Aminicenantaceae bacterium]
MNRRNIVFVCFIFSVFLLFSCSPAEKEIKNMTSSGDYEDLVSLFKEFREFHKPKMTNGVPDYSAAAMEEKGRGLKHYQDRLAAMDISSWPVPQQVDYHLVRAEMNGMEFYHRVLRPWSRDPCFYLPSQGGAGPVIRIDLRIPDNLPLPEDKIENFRKQLKAIPEIYEQAKKNLTEGAKDFAIMAIRSAKEESEAYHKLADWLAEYHPDLAAEATRIQKAVEEYGLWVEENLDRMTAIAGVGKENYNWWLKNVHLFPYTWEDCLDIVEREDNRVMTFLKLEENRNRKLPPIEPVSSQEEYRESVKASLDHVIKFLKEE